MQGNQSLGYIEPGQMKDDRLSQNLNNMIANMEVLDEDYRIIVKRTVTLEAPSRGGQGQAMPSGRMNPHVKQRLDGVRGPPLGPQVSDLLFSANNEINFQNYDKCYSYVCQAIKTLENGA